MKNLTIALITLISINTWATSPVARGWDLYCFQKDEPTRFQLQISRDVPPGSTVAEFYSAIKFESSLAHEQNIQGEAIYQLDATKGPDVSEKHSVNEYMVRKSVGLAINEKTVPTYEMSDYGLESFTPRSDFYELAFTTPNTTYPGVVLRLVQAGGSAAVTLNGLRKLNMSWPELRQEQLAEEKRTGESSWDTLRTANLYVNSDQIICEMKIRHGNRVKLIK